MTFHVPNKHRVRAGRLASTDDYGNSGAFEVPLKHGQRVFVIASDPYTDPETGASVIVHRRPQ